MNAREKRRLRRIRGSQQESATRKLNQGDRQFVIAHTPPPKRICVMSNDESQKFHDVTIGHRCTATSHRHYTRKHVEVLVQFEVARWVGKHFKIATWIEDKHWAKVQSGQVSCMQLVKGQRGGGYRGPLKES